MFCLSQLLFPLLFCLLNRINAVFWQLKPVQRRKSSINLPVRRIQGSFHQGSAAARKISSAQSGTRPTGPPCRPGTGRCNGPPPLGAFRRGFRIPPPPAGSHHSRRRFRHVQPVPFHTEWVFGPQAFSAADFPPVKQAGHIGLADFHRSAYIRSRKRLHGAPACRPAVRAFCVRILTGEFRSGRRNVKPQGVYVNPLRRITAVASTHG